MCPTFSIIAEQLEELKEGSALSNLLECLRFFWLVDLRSTKQNNKKKIYVSAI